VYAHSGAIDRTVKIAGVNFAVPIAADANHSVFCVHATSELVERSTTPVRFPKENTELPFAPQ
jgi:hypothetical protein